MRTTIAFSALLSTRALAAYVIQDDYQASSFASMFDFFTDNDPTNGYVNYISQSQAQSSGLYKIENGAVYMGVDSTNTASGRGRDSIRISSKQSYNHGLFILDLARMPAGACGSWPAWWLLGPNWPYGGEMDIIEGVNSQTANSMAGHTDPGCTITHTGVFSGDLVTNNCDINAPGQGTNVGCSIRDNSANSFGNGFNSNGGGVYATEWTSEAFNIWFFPRNAIPSDIGSGNPDPSGWGQPSGQFTGGCDIDAKYQDMKMIFDVTFCGDWAGSVWSTDATCAPKAATCQSYVQNNPSAFRDTYWLINSLKVYSQSGAAPAPTQTQPGGGPGVTTMTGLPSPSSAVTATTLETVTSNIITYTAPINQPTNAPAPAPNPTPAPAPAPDAGNDPAAGNPNWNTWAGGNNNGGGGGWGGRGGGGGGRGGGGGGRGGWGGN